MARKTTPRPWLLFQKPNSGVEEHHDRSHASPSATLDEELPEPAEAPQLDELDEPLVLPEASPVEEKQRRLRLPTLGQAKQVVAERSRSAAKQLRPWVVSHKWQFICLGIFSAIGATGLAAWLLISLVPPAVDCKKISNWSIDSERLFCAQQSAQSGKAEDLLAGINLVKDWTSENPLYGQAQLLLEDWSNALMIQARDRLGRGDLKGAIALANQVPSSSSNYKEVQATIFRWQEESRRGEKIYAKIQAALKQQNWNKAAESMADLSLVNDPGWQERLGSIRQQINAERLAWQSLLDARNFAKANPPEQLGRAIALTDPINRKTYVWDLQAKNEVLKWRNALFTLAIAKLDKNDIAGAGTLINSLPRSVQLTAANVDFVRLVRAKEAEASTDFRQPSLDRLVPILLATHLIKQVEPQSPFYSRAKDLAPKLDMKFQDILKLNWGSTLANLQQIPTLQLAVQQAESIPPNRPGRRYAQTLLAQWRKELQWMEDRPVLKQARQVAKSGKLEQLRSAVALANLIKPQRALHAEAQKDVGDWTYQIQVIEDRPIIENAKAIASSGRLGAAIDVASKIAPGRALYSEAQNLIGGWVYEIQLAEDRRTLDQAAGIAAQGSLSRAIDVAAAVGPGRPLYREAQAMIRQWEAERAEIWRQQQPPEPRYEEPRYEEPRYEEPRYEEPRYEEPPPEPPRRRERPAADPAPSVEPTPPR
jgi:hypothetical protein